MDRPSYITQEEWEILVSQGLDKIMAKSTYKVPVLPPELRVATVGWKHLLDQWEQQALLSYKKEFFRRGVEYVSLRGFLDHRVDEQIRLHRYRVRS